MRVSRAEKEKSRTRILESAARMVRKKGIEGMSVADVMSEAGLTHGGFYRHFDSKEALLSAAIGSAVDQMVGAIEERYTRLPPAEAVAAYKEMYLSPAHVAHPEMGCPIAALAGDTRHESMELKADLGAGVRRTVAAMARGMDGSPADRQAQAARALAMMVGAVMIARASDPATAAAVLEACRD